jgi:hypothetical protein
MTLRPHFAAQNSHGYTKEFLRKLSTIWASALKKFRQPCSTRRANNSETFLKFLNECLKLAIKAKWHKLLSKDVSFQHVTRVGIILEGTTVSTVTELHTDVPHTRLLSDLARTARLSYLWILESATHGGIHVHPDKVAQRVKLAGRKKKTSPTEAFWHRWKTCVENMTDMSTSNESFLL